MKVHGIEKVLKKIERLADPELKKQFALWLEATGFEFLDIVQDEIIRLQVVDFRNLLNSFKKGDKDNVWAIKNGGLTLNIGTNLSYAKIVNDGHWTVKSSTPGAFELKNGTLARWVPGKWNGSRFEYDPSSDTGMLLKQQWIEGQPYWDQAVAIFEKIFAASFERKFRQWIQSELGDG
ncbi:HK97 gp10 family phage protein [Bacillus sp. 1NLA3E]|uniref:HK97 gp10 family phage protein n=1 Tax=Bacillus sp. 1NLA3E TaxID=666686 RepID=UPI0005A24DBB|nr:HK97 gp10 family phage protein [Bacillus sp. 1NLA3E]